MSMWHRVGRLAVALAVVCVFTTLPVSAGNWVTVRYVEPPAPAVAGEPWQAQVIVKQHDIHPADVGEVTVRGTSAAHPSPIEARGTRGDTAGLYDISLVFPAAGAWNLSVEPGPFPAVALPTITVRPPGAALPAFAATVRAGTCDAPGAVLLALELEETTGDRATTLITSGAELDAPAADAPFALVVQQTTDPAGQEIACAPLARPAGESTVVPIGGGEDAPFGALVMSRSGAGLRLDLVLAIPEPTGPEVIVRIAARGGDWVYDPATVTVEPGTTVTWINETTMPHTVSGADPRFANSGMMDPGASFSQRFDEAGVYAYLCDPHPWMTGTVEVTA